MKIVGTKQYKFGAGSPSDPCKHGLGFDSMETAQEHADRMNVLRNQYGLNTIWNIEYWKEKPEAWIVFECA